LTNSIVSDNAATGGGVGGGISNFGTVTLTNSTVSGNTANNGGVGGGIHNGSFSCPGVGCSVGAQ
jgi:hypothetical protein